MRFEKTGMPDKALFRTAFCAGWSRFQDIYPSKEPAQLWIDYLRGPVAMARLVLERGGECRQIVVAACLAGPAVFTETPDMDLDKRIVDFARDVRAVEAIGSDELKNAAAGLSADIRLFLQVSAVAFLDRLAETTNDEASMAANNDLRRAYDQTMQLYSMMRGHQDTFRTDTLFEIAAMKMTTILDSGNHLWVRAGQRAANELSYA